MDYFNHSSYDALYITDDCEIGLDFNRNGKITEEEIVSLPNIRNFCSDKDIKENEKVIGNLSETEKLYFKIISKNFYKKIFLNALIRADNDIYTANFQKAEELLLENGLALPKDQNNPEKYKELILKHKNDAKNREIVLLNTKSLKYHKLNCQNGLKSAKKEYLFKDELPQKAKPCNYCFSTENFSEPLKQISFKENLCEKVSDYGNIRVFTEHGAGVYKPSTKCSSVLCKALKSEIDNSRQTIDMAVYDLNNMPEIVTALQRAAKRGVEIRVATDNDNEKNNTQTLQNIKTFAKDITTDKKPEKDANRLMHNKFFIFDGKKVWSGSANITNTGLSGFNANNAILITSPEIAKIYTEEFENFINGKFHSAKKSSEKQSVVIGKTELKVFFSPQDKVISQQVLPAIRNAKRYIYMPNFIITHQKLAQEIVNAKKRGVEVKVIIDATSARNKYSQHTLFRQNNIPVKTENFAGKMHMKTIIIDDETVFLGSMNFTKSGEVYNDENCIKIKNTEIAKNLKTEFLAIWNKIPEKYLKYDPSAESPDSLGSCFDGVDNDYDGNIDSNDTGCKAFRK
ncbi:MAG: FAM83 family protein [Candidatus Gastranaerophilales bacterium]|nr:FAM83 family protein [Candidatus Gastranaerophilales bacterium]